MNKIPISLIFFRLALGLIIIVLSVCNIEHYKKIAIFILSLGLLTDIFDGIIARQLNVSTVALRRMDSTVDQVFFTCFAIATYIQCPIFFKDNVFKLIILVFFEGLTYLICFLKFKKEIATHTLGAKIWTLLLFATIVQVIVQCNSFTLFYICFWVGLITRIEIVAIILILKKWTNDVPTFFDAIKLRNNKEIKRRKIFNG